jgi:hypothetical protein
MNYTPVRVDKNTGNVWKWKRNEDGTVISVSESMWKPADKWEDHEISLLFNGTAVVVHSEPVIQEPEVIIEEEGIEVDDPVAEDADEPVVQEQPSMSDTSFN